MRYRINRRTGDRISEIGIGSSYMFEAGMKEGVRALRCAYDGGINHFDLAAGDGSIFPIYGEALTAYQCLQYVLDKPAVLTVLPGAQSIPEVQNLLDFENASNEERDYSIIGSFTPGEAKSRCVYCNHCKPCPAGIDIGLVNKYYDLALAGDVMAVQHYKELDKKAEDCIQCGHCDSRCPFSVHQSKRMIEIDAYMQAV